MICGAIQNRIVRRLPDKRMQTDDDVINYHIEKGLLSPEQ